MGSFEAVSSPELWPHQQRMLDGFLADRKVGQRKIAAVSATGTGKSHVMFRLIQDAVRNHERITLYTNRRLLFDQLARGMDECGITHGKRASGHKPQLKRDVQLCMVQTEMSKVLRDMKRQHHACDLVIVDEVHMNCNGAILELMNTHHDEGACVLGFTATPLNIGHFFNHMVEGAKNSEGRQCGALFPAQCYGPDIPDRKYIGRVKVGEEISPKLRSTYLKSIFGRVVDHWYKYNPDRRPTMLFAPGVKESLWFAQELYKLGINAAHIDAKGVWMEGNWHPGDMRRHECLQKLKDNRIEILSNRFVLREGLDVPELYHCILATKFGSETAFVQAVGRPLRAHHSLPGHVVIQDHGGNFLDHGSPNEDRIWDLQQTAEERSYVRREQIRRNEQPEPFTCPECFAIRRSGTQCWNCGLVATQRKRIVVQADGTLKEAHGKHFRDAAKATTDAQLKLWKSCYWSAKKNNERTFSQTFAWFGQLCREKYGRYYKPNPNWPFMPTRIVDEVRRVCDVPTSRLTPSDKEPLDARR